MRIFSFSIFLAVSTFFFHSCGHSQPVAKEAPLAQSLLWKVEHKDLPEPSYVFGTIHMIPKEDFFLPTGLEEALTNTDDVVFEIDMDDMTGIGSLMGMLSNIMMKEGMTLDKLLSEQEYSEVSAFFEEMGLPMFLLNKVKPMFLSMLAEINMDPSEMQSDNIMSYEMELYEKAQNLNKEVGGLETVGYQMSLFDSIPYKDQAMMLVDAVRGTDVEDDLFEKTLELYKTQNIEAMVEMIGSSDAQENSNYEDVLLRNRNVNWIPVMQKMMKSKPTLFAVGAGHLGGEHGVIRLLKKAGYTVTPVSTHKSTGQKQRV